MTYTYDQLEGTFLGLALGDAYGRPLEFETEGNVLVNLDPLGERCRPFMWTDDTHMSLYLARALTDASEGEGFDPDTVGHAIGHQFIEWLCDPLTPHTAPGNTCIRGTENYSSSRDWKTSGVKSSDGCGAVMRIAPLPFFYSGEELTQVAEIQAQITHAHPNALEAAIAGAHLLKAALDNRSLGRGHLEHALIHLQEGGAWHRGGDVAESLRDTLGALDHVRDETIFLNTEDFHPGDGGWRSGSALAIALYALLRHPMDNSVVSSVVFERIMSTATRHPGDSDSTGAIAGMFFGAIHGPLYLPREWINKLDRTGDIYETLAEIPHACKEEWVNGPLTTITRPGLVEGLVFATNQGNIQKGSTVTYDGRDYTVEGFFHDSSLMASVRPHDQRYRTGLVTIAHLLSDFEVKKPG